MLHAHGTGLMVAWWYYGDTHEFRSLGTMNPDDPDDVARLWDEVQQDVLKVIAALSAPDRTP